MAKEKELPTPKAAWWIDQSGGFSGGISFGDKMPEKVPQSRLNELHELEKVSFEEPEDKETVTVSQVDKLRDAVTKLNEENKELKEVIAKTPKGVQAAKAELKKVKIELAEFKKSAVKSDPAKVEELATLKTRVSDLEGFVSDRDAEIKQLKTDLEAATDPKDGK